MPLGIWLVAIHALSMLAQRGFGCGLPLQYFHSACKLSSAPGVWPVCGGVGVPASGGLWIPLQHPLRQRLCGIFLTGALDFAQQGHPGSGSSKCRLVPAGFGRHKPVRLGVMFRAALQLPVL